MGEGTIWLVALPCRSVTAPCHSSARARHPCSPQGAGRVGTGQVPHCILLACPGCSATAQGPQSLPLYLVTTAELTLRGSQKVTCTEELLATERCTLLGGSGTPRDREHRALLQH